MTKKKKQVEKIVNAPVTEPLNEQEQAERDAEQLRDDTDFDKKPVPEKPKKSIFKKPVEEDILEEKLSVVEQDELEKERASQLANVIVFAEKHAEIARLNGHTQAYSYLNTLLKVAKEAQKITDKKSYFAKRVK